MPVRGFCGKALLAVLVAAYPSVSAAQDGRGEEGQRWIAATGPACSGRAAPPSGTSSLQRWSRVAARPPVKRTDPIRLTAYAWIRFFQKGLSPVDGPSCTFYPTCSAYGLQAIEKHGLFIGIPMAAERIMRDHRPDDPGRYLVCEHEGDFYYWDPVESNDGWWATGP